MCSIKTGGLLKSLKTAGIQEPPHMSTWTVVSPNFPDTSLKKYINPFLLPLVVREFVLQSAISKGLPEELSSRGAHLNEPAGQALALNHGGHSGQTVPLYQAAGHACRCAALPGRDDDAQAVMTAAAHGSTSGVHHEADQEAEGKQDILANEYISLSIIPVLRMQTPNTRRYCGGFL